MIMVTKINRPRRKRFMIVRLNNMRQRNDYRYPNRRRYIH